MNTIAKAVGLGMFLIAAVSSANAATVFSDNFDGGPAAAWGNESGSWTTAAGGYYATFWASNPNARSFVTGLTLSDFSVDVDVTSGINGGVWLRAQNTGTNYGAVGILFVFAGGNVYWHDMTSDNAYGPVLNAVTNPYAGGDFSVHIEVQGNLYSAYLNGAASPITTLTSSSFTSGLAGLYDDAASQRFDNFRIDVVPLPAAFPVFAGGLGVLGLFGRRRKQKAAAVAA